MKRTLRVLAFLLVVAAAGYWAATGANTGWTKNRVEVKTVEPVTGLDDLRWKDQFVPGVDFLGAAALGVGVLAGASFLFREKTIRR